MRHPLLQLGACVCALLGVLYAVITTQLIFKRAFFSWIHAVILVVYVLFAFAPFIVFVFPGLKAPRRSVIFGGVAIEVLVLGLFIRNLLTD